MLNKSTREKSMPKEISPSNYLSIVWEHLTEELCEEVFQLTRDRERQRKWTLFALLRVWMGLLQSPLASQTGAIEACGSGHPLFPLVEASPESFFMRIQSIRPTFFRNVYLRFTQKIEDKFPKNFVSSLLISEKDFPEIYVLDGSRLAKVGRLLKIARNTTKAIIPGSLEAVYDLRRGFLRNLFFDPDGARSEIAMLERILPEIPQGALVVTDRYYAKPLIWQKVKKQKIEMVSRYNATVKRKRCVKVLSRIRTSKVAVDDWIVEMGGSQPGSQPVILRWVHVRNSEGEIILITDILDPKRLSVVQLLSLYRERWNIERMYLHLKEVLSLNRLFNASPAAVGQQAYATAILYNALRLSQASIAQEIGIAPELLSPDKLFPRLIEKFLQITWMELGSQMKKARQSLFRNPSLRIPLKGILVEKRSGTKRRRRFCAGRKSWTTYNKIPGGKKYLWN